MSCKLTSFCLATLIANVAFASGPYAPEVGQQGSTAIALDDSRIVAWATGYESMVFGEAVDDDAFRNPENALGAAEGLTHEIVSLGRGGQITLLFDTPISNGEGPDFAIFENAFDDFFLELAFVEVSSNGVDFVRFPNASLTAEPVGGFGEVDPTNVYNLAGKYRRGYGTPFDLGDVSGNPLLDIEQITHVRLIDIVGDGSVVDSSGHVIYEPYPTVGSAGFDLDAVGVIHEYEPPEQKVEEDEEEAEDVETGDVEGEQSETDSVEDPVEDRSLSASELYFGDLVDLGADWKWSEWFGYLSDGFFPWIYHNRHGWLYASGSGNGSYWIYSPEKGWLWTSSTSYPYIWSDSLTSWMYHYQSEEGQVWYVDLSTNEWFQ